MSHLDLIEPDRQELDQSTRRNSTDERSGGVGQDVYHCPGESHPISRSIHLARLASGFSECQNCSHRHQHGALKCPTVTGSVKERRVAHMSLLAPEGIRGVYLNELDRIGAADWGAAFASMIWDEQPRFARQNSNRSLMASVVGSAVDQETSGTIVEPDFTARPTDPSEGVRRGPVVVVGFDERPSSPDIVVGVAIGLRRMGCEVIDLGQTSNPCFQFAVHHLEAAGGIFVTGSGCDPSWTGFNFAGRNALPWTEPRILEEIESRALAKVVRPTRTAGSQRSFHATVPYEAGLWKFFHALRPLQVVCGTSSRLLQRTLESVFERLPCGLAVEPLPVRRRDLDDPNDPDVRRVASRVIAEQKHLGLIIDDDGEKCAFVCENGRLVSASELATLLIAMELRDHRSTQILLDDSLSAGMARWQSSREADVEFVTSPTLQMAAMMMAGGTQLGFSADHRVWFRNSYSVCDAILTLARVLQAMSLSDSTMSQVIGRSALADGIPPNKGTQGTIVGSPSMARL